VQARNLRTVGAAAWATFDDASDQAGQSRLWRGIHIQRDDFAGRVIGSRSDKEAWALALKYDDGTATQ